MSQKTASKTLSPKGGLKGVNPGPPVTDEAPSGLNPVNEWLFKVTGRGTSGWMSWVKENGKWVPLRQSETSFISAISAIEPEVMRLAFPHTATNRRPK